MRIANCRCPSHHSQHPRQWGTLIDANFIAPSLSFRSFQSTSPAYHLLHGHFEWRWFYLTIKLRIEQERSMLGQLIAANTLRDSEFEEKLKLFIYDLIVVATAKFNRVTVNRLHRSWTFLVFIFHFSCTFRNYLPKLRSCASASRKCGSCFSCLLKNCTITAANWTHFGFTLAMYWNSFAIGKVSSLDWYFDVWSMIIEYFQIHTPITRCNRWNVAPSIFIQTTVYCSPFGFLRVSPYWMDTSKMDFLPDQHVIASRNIPICSSL